MFRKTFTGTLVAASLTTGALLTMPSASAAPTWTHIQDIGLSGALQSSVSSAVADNGDTVVAWLRNDRVMAASAKNGVFGPAYYVSDPEDVAVQPSVGLNDNGDAVITWVQEDNLGHARLTGNRRNADRSWTPNQVYLTAPADQDVEGKAASVAVQANGTARIAYQSTDGGTVHQARLATWVDGASSAATAIIGDTTSFFPDVDVTDDGTVLVGFWDKQGAESQIKTRRLPAGVNFWELAKPASAVGSFSIEVEVALSDSGYGTVAMSRLHDGHIRAQAAKVSPNGTVTNTGYITPEGVGVIHLDLDQNAAGTALLSYVLNDNGNQQVGYASRSLNGSWNDAALATPIDAPTRTVAAIADNGTQFVAYTGNERMLASYRTSTFLPFTQFNSGDINATGNSVLAGIDSQGNAFLGAISLEADPTQSQAVGRFLDTAGATTWMTKPGLNTIGTDPAVSWDAADRLSELGTGNVRLRTAFWNGAFGGYTYPLQDTAEQSMVFDGTGGRTYCFSAQTRDSHNNLGSWSTEKCTTTALDDGVLHAADGFTRVKKDSAYYGGYSSSKTKGASLRVTGVKASRIALLVNKVATGGKVAVYFRGVKLGTYSLKGSGEKQIIANTGLGEIGTGTIVIKVVSESGRTVRIDGVYAAK